jgi:two-component system heavy metal sensor histidine kinase CusS
MKVALILDAIRSKFGTRSTSHAQQWRPANAVRGLLAAASRSIALRVAVYCSLLAGITLASMLVLAYLELDSALRERAHAELDAEHNIIRAALADVTSRKDLGAGEARASALRSRHAGLSVVVFAPGLGSPILSLGDEAHELLAFSGAHPWNGMRDIGTPDCFLAVTLETVRLRDGMQVQLAVAIDRSSDRALLRAYRWRLMLMWIAGIGIVGAFAAVIARGSLTLLRAFTLQVSRMSARRLGQRIDLAAVPSELSELAGTFNDLFARLDDAFRRLDGFSADIAHELRSPLANLITRTQVALSRPRSSGDYLEALGTNAEELERLRRMVDDMLLLARAENPGTTIAREAIDLRLLCGALAEFYQISADDLGMRIEVSGAATTRGDHGLVRRAVGNLLANALRYAPADGTIRVCLDTDDEAAVIRVVHAAKNTRSDLGPQIFERFVRGDRWAADARTDTGTGLGLAIVRSIMQLHGGAAGVETPPGGVIAFWLRFPRVRCL